MLEKKPGKKRIAALDYGLARIGIAISDENRIIAMPFITITTEKKLENTAAKVIRELAAHEKAYLFSLEEILVGMPLLLNGKKGFLADEVNSFVEALSKATTVPIVLWDERLTSVQADRSLREGTMTRRQRSKHVDTVAAVILLQSYLDRKGFERDQQDKLL
jgi:putative Holliday junction resolvase